VTTQFYSLYPKIIFPAKGSCPHPFEMSNGDLDGDIFFISWKTELIPREQYLFENMAIYLH
jgi:RNA dependent RNA polymerase